MTNGQGQPAGAGARNLLMLSGDRTLAAGEHGPFLILLNELSRYWNRIDILTPRGARSGSRQVLANVRAHAAPLGRWAQPLFILATGSRLMREHAYDLVVSHDYGLFYNGLGARLLQRRFSTPWVSEIHHVDGFPRAANLRHRCSVPLTRGYVRWASPHVTAFRTVSSQVRELLASWGIPPQKLLMLPSLYLDRDVYSPLPDTVRDVDVLFCGRLELEKGIPLFLDTVRLLVRQNPAIRVLMVGRGRLVDSTRRVLAEGGLGENVELVEWLDDPSEMARAYRRSRILVCTSFAEGNPRVVAEAMACGVNVVSTPVGIVPELLRNGENGFLVDWNAESIGARVADLLANQGLQAEIARQAPRAVLPYAAADVIRRLAEAYLRIAGEGRR